VEDTVIVGEELVRMPKIEPVDVDSAEDPMEAA